MDKFNLNELANSLNQTEVGFTYGDEQKKWNTAADVADIVKRLQDTPSVNFLALEGNTLGVEAAEAIGKALESHPKFKKAFWRNMFTGRLLEEIPKALISLSNGLMNAGAQLTVLDLSDNALGPNGMRGIEDLLRSPVCYSLEELRLNNCGLGITGGKMLAKALIECLNVSTKAGTPLKLKVFIAGRNRLENEGGKAIARFFDKITSLVHVEMPQNGIYHEGIYALSEAIMKNKNLEVLNFNDNTITPKGAASLVNIFADTERLREINFGDCLLRSHGGYLFVDVLEQYCDKIESIDLSFNEIRGNAGLAIATALQNKPNLKSLNLNGNMFGSSICEQIVEITRSFRHPDCLVPFDEDQSADEDDEEEDPELDGNSEDLESYDDEDEYDQGEDEDDDDDEEGYDEDDDVEGEEDEEYTKGEDGETTEEAEWDGYLESNLTPDKATESNYLTPSQTFMAGTTPENAQKVENPLLSNVSKSLFATPNASIASVSPTKLSALETGNIFGQNASNITFGSPKPANTTGATSGLFGATGGNLFGSVSSSKSETGNTFGSNSKLAFGFGKPPLATSSAAGSGNVFGLSAPQLSFGTAPTLTASAPAANPSESTPPAADSVKFIPTPKDAAGVPLSIIQNCPLVESLDDILSHGPRDTCWVRDRHSQLIGENNKELFLSYERFVIHQGPLPLESLNSLKGNKLEGFVHVLCTFDDQWEYIAATMFTILKISNLSGESQEAMDIATIMFQQIFTYAEKEYNDFLPAMCKFLLKHLRMMTHDEENVFLYPREPLLNVLIRTLRERDLPVQVAKTLKEHFLKNGVKLN